MKLPINIPIVSFFGRYWLLAGLFIVFLLLTLNEHIFQAIGTFVYAPPLCTLSLLLVVFLRHIFFAKSLDEDVRTGKFVEWWDDLLSPQEKARWILGVTCALFVGICQIIAALAK